MFCRRVKGGDLLDLVFFYLNGSDCVVISDIQLVVLIIQELSPAVGCSGQHVVETLVILYQEGEDMLRLFIAIPQNLHVLSITFDADFFGLFIFILVGVFVLVGVFFRFCSGPRIQILLSLYVQNASKQLLGHPGAAGLSDGHHLVGTVDLQDDVHAVFLIVRQHLVYVIVVADGEVTVSQTDLGMLEHLVEHVPVDTLVSSIHTLSLCDADKGESFCRLIHLLVETEFLDRKSVFQGFLRFFFREDIDFACRRFRCERDIGCCLRRFLGSIIMEHTAQGHTDYCHNI